MAFIDIEMGGNQTLTFYNVSEAVGTGGKNWEEDVKIVQFFLQRIYTRPKYQKLKPWGEMKVDGKCGPITRAWITKFQSDARNHGLPLVVDGIVNKAGHATGNFISSVSKTYYSIRIINNMMYLHDQEVYKNLTTHPDVPQDVRLIFLQIQSQGPPMVYEHAQTAAV